MLYYSDVPAYQHLNVTRGVTIRYYLLAKRYSGIRGASKVEIKCGNNLNFIMVCIRIIRYVFIGPLDMHTHGIACLLLGAVQ